MTMNPAGRLYATLAAILLLWATPALAQFQPRPMADDEPDAPTGERYFVEGFVGLWKPSATLTLASDGTGALGGIIGTDINLKDDFGLTDQQFPEFRVTLRPGRRHKLRFHYIPIEYSQSALVQREIVFNGQAIDVGINVNSLLQWKAYRFAYEIDFLVFSRGFAGIVLDAKYTDMRAVLEVPGLLVEDARAAAPIPALGGIVRVYVVPNVGITAEVTGIKVPEFDGRSGHYADIDIYGTVNFTNNVGVQAGYRSLDFGIDAGDETLRGQFILRGLYFGGVARF